MSCYLLDFIGAKNHIGTNDIAEKFKVTEKWRMRTNRGRDLIRVQNVIKKHQASMGEINNHGGRLDKMEFEVLETIFTAAVKV